MPDLEEPSCGRGLAEHATLPAMLGEVMAAVAENLEAHLAALDPGDERARRERDVYEGLAAEHRELAERLRATAQRMRSQRDLAMGRHDDAALRRREALSAFERLVKSKRALRDVLERTAEQDQAMLVDMATRAQHDER